MDQTAISSFSAGVSKAIRFVDVVMDTFNSLSRAHMEHHRSDRELTFSSSAPSFYKGLHCGHIDRLPANDDIIILRARLLR